MDENNNLYNTKNSGPTYHYGTNDNTNGKSDFDSSTTYEYYQTATITEDKKKHHKHERKESGGVGRKIVALVGSAVVFGCIAGAVMFGVNMLGNKIVGENKSISTTEIAPVTTTTKDSSGTATTAVADVVENVMPSIVSVTNTSVQHVRSWFQSYEQEVKGAGSGIIIGQTNDEILIVTNNHVINGANEITITFCDETSVAATVKGSDSISDLAVLAVKTKDMEEETVNKIKVAALGSSTDLRVGESAIAIGNALGYGQSVTVGYISALSREVEADDASTIEMLQTDAAINPGNSGGALLNENGEVIGINSAKYVDSTVEGMGYAIPISDAIPIINDLMKQEVIAEDEQGYLGIQGNDITDEYASGFSMPKGVYVVKILDDSPANDCGLKAGDIITKFAGRDITSMENLQSILSKKKAGEEIEMVIQRNNEKGEYEEVTLKVTLGAKKDMPNSNNNDNSDNTEEQDNFNEDSMEQGIPEDFMDEFEYFFGR
ncbi:MAG: S1C family serine protease [Lachnospiraceae bacterium]